MPRVKTIVGVTFIVGIPLAFALMRDWSGLALGVGIYAALFGLVYARASGVTRIWIRSM
jgi:hypothetical protein